MFKNILFPTDGSAASEAALPVCLGFAKESGARVTALYVVPEFHMFTVNADMLEDTREEYLRHTAAQGTRVLEAVEKLAKEEGVPCEAIMRRNDEPYQAILAEARERGCDLIAMASHGRRGVKALLLGSETQKVLVHSMIPVLVLRTAA